MDIPDTIGNRMVVQILSSPNVCFYITWGNGTNAT